MGLIEEVQSSVSSFVSSFRNFLFRAAPRSEIQDLESVVNEVGQSIGELVPVNVSIPTRPQQKPVQEQQMRPQMRQPMTPRETALYKMQQARQIQLETPKIAMRQAAVKYVASTRETTNANKQKLQVELVAVSYEGKDGEWRRLSSAWLEMTFNLSPDNHNSADAVEEIGFTQVIKNGMDVTGKYAWRSGSLHDYLEAAGFFER